MASPSGGKPPAARCAGSTPARRTLQSGPFVYRFRTPASHAGKAGSIPARVTFENTQKHDQVVQLVDTRRSERRAHSGLGVRLSPWSFVIRCRRGWRPTGSHKAGLFGSIPGPATWKLITTQVGQRPVKAHNLRLPGATPGPATSRPSTQTGKAASSRGW